jgi:pimeloyl-ACP methyl ester carboxylesterase
MPMRRLIFLPGAGASAAFWAPVAQRLPSDWDKRLLSWPGLGHEPADPAVRGLEDLLGLVLAQLDEPADLIAQSMGGYLAVRAALQAPEKVRSLTLVATSGGIDVDALGAADWRPDYRTEYPRAARWLEDVRHDLTGRLHEIDAPTLLIWGDADPVSPLAVGERLQELIPHAELRIVRGGEHDLAHARPDEVAGLIARHLEP